MRARPAWLAPRWIAGHLIILLIAVLFVRLGWWQIRSALSGHVVSIGYALQWPAFAGFGIFMWVRHVRMTARDESPADESPADEHPDEDRPADGSRHAPDTSAVPLAWTFDRERDGPA